VKPWQYLVCRTTFFPGEIVHAIMSIADFGKIHRFNWLIKVNVFSVADLPQLPD
jgi:hypothetical protein